MMDKKRMGLFIALAVILVGVVVAILVLVPTSNQTPETPSPDTTIIPENPENTEPTTPPEEPTEPQPIPESPEEEEIPIEEPEGPAEAGEEHGGLSDVEAAAAAVAQNGLVEWCRINTDEPFEQRQARLSPYFDPNSSAYTNEPLEALLHERQCEVEAMSNLPDFNEDGTYTWNISLLVASKTLPDSQPEVGYAQYSVQTTNTAILNINE